MNKSILTLDSLRKEANRFAVEHASISDAALYGVTDGKAVGTYIEQRFHQFLADEYDHVAGSSSKGRDLPDLNVDLKVTNARQPQSSCPFRSATQKIYGLGYSLLIFVYEKEDDDDQNVGVLKIVTGVFVDKSRTGDFQTTIGLRDLIQHNANVDDIMAFIEDRRLPVDDIQARKLAERILKDPPEIGYLTISNALQWRLQYGRVVDNAGKIEGLSKIGSAISDK